MESEYDSADLEEDYMLKRKEYSDEELMMFAYQREIAQQAREYVVCTERRSC